MDASVYVILCCLVLGGDASGSCGALTLMTPTFLNRNVTLKFIPHNQWITNIVWKYSLWWDETREYAVKGLKGRFQQLVQDGSHYHSLLFYMDKYFNNSKFHVQCSHIMKVIRSNTVKIHLHEIRKECGNLVLLSPEIKYGTDVEIAYYPSDYTLIAGNIWYHERTLLKGVARPVHLRNDTFEERKMSVYLYILTIHNYTESKAGHYALRCGKSNVIITNWLNIHVTEKGSDHIILNMPENIHNENTTISCQVSNVRAPALLEILVDNLAIIGVVQEDFFNKTLKTFTCKASISKIDKQWNGKEICCRRKLTKNRYIEASCKTLGINCSLGNDTRANGLCNETKWMSNITKVEEDGIIKQNLHPPKNRITFRPEPTSVAGGNSTRSFKVTLEPILIGTGAFVALCVFVASARSLVRWHIGRKRTRDPDNTEVTLPAIEASPSLDTNEYVEMPETSMHVNASHDLEDDYAELKIREDSILARKPITAVESKHAESSLIYADLDIDHLQYARVGPIPGPRPTIGKEATVYDDINFSNTNPVGPHLVL